MNVHLVIIRRRFFVVLPLEFNFAVRPPRHNAMNRRPVGLGCSLDAVSLFMRHARANRTGRRRRGANLECGRGVRWRLSRAEKKAGSLAHASRWRGPGESTPANPA